MLELDKLIEKHFKSSNEKLSFNTLLEMIEEQMDSLSLIFEEESPISSELGKEANPLEDKVIRFPKIKITENWGQKNNEDRGIFLTLMENIGGNTVEEKIQSVAEFTKFKEGLSISEILSHLMFLEIFSNILEEFNPSVAGFLFEAFLSGLLKGVQISDPEGGSLPIQDMEIPAFVQRGFGESDEVVPYSLKVLSPKTELKGSFKNLVDFYLTPHKDTGKLPDSVTYLAVIKEGGTNDPSAKLRFIEFSITRKNFFDWIGHELITSERTMEAVSFVPAEIVDSETGALKIGDFVIANASWAWPGKMTDNGFVKAPPSSASKSKKLAYEEIPAQEKIYWGLPAKVTGEPYNLSTGGPGVLDPETEYTINLYTGETEFVKTGKRKEDYKKIFGDMVFNHDDPSEDLFRRLAKESEGYEKNRQWHISPSFYRNMGKTIGYLDLSAATLRRTAESYASNLGESLIGLYNAMSLLSINVNRYFLASDKIAGMEALKNATTVKQESANLIHDKES